MVFLLYVSLFFAQLIEPSEKVELKIDSYSLIDSTLKLNCSINNGTSTVHSVYYGGDWVPILGILNLTLFILENDTLSLSKAYPFGGYPSTKYRVIKPYNKEDITIEIDLKHLYKLEHIFQGPPHLLTGVCSFQLVYYDIFFGRNKRAAFKAYLDGKRVRKHTPISDTLRSNVVYIDMRNQYQNEIE